MSLLDIGALCMLKQVCEEKGWENKSPVLCSSVNWMFYLCLPVWKKKKWVKPLVDAQATPNQLFLFSLKHTYLDRRLIEKREYRFSQAYMSQEISLCRIHTPSCRHTQNSDRQTQSHTLRELSGKILCQSLEETFPWQNEWNLTWEELSSAPDSNVNVYQTLMWATV